MKKSQRQFLVTMSLLAVLSFTSALLLALAPAPLTPDAASSLFAIDAPASLDVVFNTRQPIQPGRWKYLFIHQSHTTAGNALTLGQATGGLGDHFVIGNGDGCVDGEIQIGQRWSLQQAALPPVGAADIDPGCISICLIGDFERGVPTPTQLRRLGQLIGALQGRLNVPAGNVLMLQQPNTPTGIGRYFPVAAFRAQLLP